MRNFWLILVFVIVAGGLGGVAFYYKHEITSISKILETERYSRLVAEEKVVNSVSKINQLQDDLIDNQEKITKIQDLLKEEKNVNKDLDSQFQKLSKAKSQLEKQIETLISQKALAVEATAPAKETVQQNESVQQNEVVAQTH